LLSVIETFDGKGVFTDCVLGLNNCSNENPCPYHYSVQKFRTEFINQIQDESFDASAKRITEHGLKLKDIL
jgi:DNA-binding IscR family transcriptional regulator